MDTTQTASGTANRNDEPTNRLVVIGRWIQEEWRENRVFFIFVPLIVIALAVYITIHVISKSTDARIAIAIILGILLLLPLLHLIGTGVLSKMATGAKCAYIFLIMVIGVVMLLYHVLEDTNKKGFSGSILILTIMHGSLSVIPTLFPSRTATDPPAPTTNNDLENPSNTSVLPGSDPLSTRVTPSRGTPSSIDTQPLVWDFCDPINFSASHSVPQQHNRSGILEQPPVWDFCDPINLRASQSAPLQYNASGKLEQVGRTAYSENGKSRKRGAVSENQQSKRMVVGRQILKANPELDDDGPEPEMGTSKKASDNVLAARRIAEVKRSQPTTQSSASNPFASLKLVPPSDPSNIKPDLKNDTLVKTGVNEKQEKAEEKTEEKAEKTQETIPEPESNVECDDSETRVEKKIENEETVREGEAVNEPREGEENENEKAVFTADAALYEYIDGNWKRRGKGKLKLIVSLSEDEIKARLVMRTKDNYGLILNACLYPDMTLTTRDKNGWTFACINSAGEGKTGLATFSIIFEDHSFVQVFRTAVEAYKGIKSAALMKTPENSPKASEV